MNTQTGPNGRRSSLSSGLAVTALVVVVGVAAAIADLGPPGSAAAGVHVEGAIAPAVAAAATDEFQVPDALRINEAEVPPHVQAF
ncbi:MAG: hypothetical protein U1F58_08990 [Burkholderiales bacterium]